MKQKENGSSKLGDRACIVPSPFTNISTEKVKAYAGELTAVLEEEGDLRAETIVDWARKNEGSAIHTYFTWDNSEAANKQRIYEARQLVRTIHIRYVTPEGRARTTRKFVPIHTKGTTPIKMKESSERGYIPVEKVLIDDTKERRKRLRLALNELHSWARRHEAFNELDSFAEKIKKLTNRTLEEYPEL